MTIGGAGATTWTNLTTEVRALQKSDAGDADRIAGAWYNSDSFIINVNIKDSKAHQVALYALDFDNSGRNQTIQVIDVATGAILDSRAMSSIQGGVYAVWTVKGTVTFKVINTGSSNGVISGIFFD